MDRLRELEKSASASKSGKGDDDVVEKEDASERVLWCKNWTALQSVRSLEHVHVFVRNVPDEVIVEWTGDKGLVQG